MKNYKKLLKIYNFTNFFLFFEKNYICLNKIKLLSFNACMIFEDVEIISLMQFIARDL